MVIKVDKAKLIMEEVEQFDDISLEDLVDGISVPARPSILTLTPEIQRAAGKLSEIHRPVI